ncbi:MAG: hypothetical protein ACE5PV_06160 [Candidatus Poribacteria bacterium]
MREQGLSGRPEKEAIVLHKEAIVDSTGQLSIKIDRKVKEIVIKIDYAIEPVYQELGDFRYWPALAAAGVWTIAASLIASLIFKIFLG